MITRDATASELQGMVRAHGFSIDTVVWQSDPQASVRRKIVGLLINCSADPTPLAAIDTGRICLVMTARLHSVEVDQDQSRQLGHTVSGHHERIQSCSTPTRRRNIWFLFSLWINTMNRCPAPSRPLRLAALCVLALAATGLLPISQAQTLHRHFPDNALRGTMVVQQPPLITLDGRQTQLSPGARIRSTGNTLLLSGALIGQQLAVNYTLEPSGSVHEVWVLTPTEIAEKRPRAADLKN